MESGDYWSDPAAHVPSVVQSATASAATQLEHRRRADVRGAGSPMARCSMSTTRAGRSATGCSYGVAHFGNCYGAAALATGLARQTLMQMARVAGQFAPARRRDRALARASCRRGRARFGFAGRWLDRAREQQLNSRQLQAQLNAIGGDGLPRARRQRAPAPGRAPDRGGPPFGEPQPIRLGCDRRRAGRHLPALRRALRGLTRVVGALTNRLSRVRAAATPRMRRRD